MYNYCTLFKSNYLTRGLALYESLKKHSQEFHLYFFAFDDKSYSILKNLCLKYTTVISLEEFEDTRLLKIKNDRTEGEYCWTCTPSIIKYSIEKYNLDSCTYLDADLYFFSDPTTLIEEMADESVLITEHRFTPEYDYSADCGIYCVQFVTFKNDADGMQALNWWRDVCIEWCYNRAEDGKFGDQKYLDDWLERFKGVHVLQHLGGGMAPWNVQQYKLSSTGKELYISELGEEKKFAAVFYHFQGLRFIENNKVDFGRYVLNKDVIEQLYVPYVKHLQAINKTLRDIDDSCDYHGTIATQAPWKNPIRKIKRIIQKNYNVYPEMYFHE